MSNLSRELYAQYCNTNFSWNIETKYIAHTQDLMAKEYTRTFKNLDKAIEYIQSERKHYADKVIENDRHYGDGSGYIDDDDIACIQKVFFYIERITRIARLDY